MAGSTTDPDDNLLALYLDPQPGTYHRKDADPTAVYHNGTRIAVVTTEDPKRAAGMAAVLVCLLNKLQQKG